MSDFAQRTILVTGASSGLGAHFARLFAAHGAAVVLAARRVQMLEALATQISEAGGRSLAVAMDVADPASTSAAFDTAEQVFGPVDSVIANAGMNCEGFALDLAPTDLERLMAVNIGGVFHTVTEAARRMIAVGAKQREHGRVIIISSITANSVWPVTAAYAGTKAGVQQMGKVLAREWANKGISVNIVNPGYIETELTAEMITTEGGKAMIAKFPRRRLLEASDLDPVMLMLASDAARRITGSVFTIDDGQSL